MKMYSYYMKEMLFVNKSRKNILCYGFYAVLLLIIIIVSVLPQLFSRNGLRNHRQQRYATDLKYILIWTDNFEKKKGFHYFEKSPRYPEGQTLLIREKCPFINCYISYNKSLLKETYNFDAVVFNVNDIKQIKPDEINLTRSLHQKYIFHSLEPFDKHALCAPSYDDFFNWTWTYKLNSDIPHPFLNIYDKNHTLIGPRRNVTWMKSFERTDRFKKKIMNKDKAVAWVVGNCKLKSKHKDFLEDFRNELKGYNYTLDIFGPCGKIDCPHGQSIKCFKMIEKQYYFQLVLEDSFAEDYVTDRLAKVLSHVTIPIVLGDVHYNNFLPPGGYINAQAFDMKKLGAIIDFLIKNPKMYSYFFDWMNHYYYTVRPNNYICDLCSKLNDESVNEYSSYVNFREWWNSDYKEECQRLQLINLFAKDYL